MSQQMTIQIDHLTENQRIIEKIDELIDPAYGFCSLIEDSIQYDSATKKVSFRVDRPLWELPVDQMKKTAFPLSLIAPGYRVPCAVSLVEIFPVEKFEKEKLSACPGLDVLLDGNALSIVDGDIGAQFSLEITKETKLIMRDAGENKPDKTRLYFSGGQIQERRQLMESLALKR